MFQHDVLLLPIDIINLLNVLFFVFKWARGAYNTCPDQMLLFALELTI